MPATYKTGTKAEVMRSMATFAIRDQQALIDAYTPRFGEPTEDARQVIKRARDCIADFRRVLKLTPKTS